MSIDKWKICSKCKCKTDFKQTFRLSENKEASFHSRKDYFNVCLPCFKEIIDPMPVNQYQGYPRWANKVCNTCSKAMSPVTNYFISGTVQYHFAIWDWDSYRAFFCTDCIYPFMKFIKKENIISEYAHVNYKPRDESWGKY